MNIPVHIWSDVACPWCFVGKRQLEEAARASGVQLRTTWHSFELDPRPRGPDDKGYVQRLADKYGIPPQQAQAMIDQMTDRGRPLGIAFDFGRAIPANTFDAHRLLHLALHEDANHSLATGEPAAQERKPAVPSAPQLAARSLQDRLKERLLLAHFSEGLDVADANTLHRLASEVGLNVDRVAATLHSDEFAHEVRQDEGTAREMGVSGVPFFVIGRYGVGGAQPKELLIEVLNKAAAESDEEPMGSTSSGGGASSDASNKTQAPAQEGDACDPDGC